MTPFCLDRLLTTFITSSDPGTFKISVVNQAGGGTPFTQTIAPSVNTPDGKYLIKGGTVTAPAG